MDPVPTFPNSPSTFSSHAVTPIGPGTPDATTSSASRPADVRGSICDILLFLVSEGEAIFSDSIFLLCDSRRD